MKNFILKNKTTILVVLSLLFLLGFCKKQSDVKKVNKQFITCQEEKKELINNYDSLKVEYDKLIIEKNNLTQLDGVKTTGCEKQIILLDNMLLECKYDRDRYINENNKLKNELEKINKIKPSI
jgi:cell division protein FtsL